MAHLKGHWRSGSSFPRHPAAEAKILEPDLYTNVSGSREGEFPDLETQFERQVWKHPEVLHFDVVAFLIFYFRVREKAEIVQDKLMDVDIFTREAPAARGKGH